MNCDVTYEKLGNLAQVSLNKPTKRFIAQLLGLCYEPIPYCLVALKSHVKIALHLTSKLANLLNDYKKYLLSLIMYLQPGVGENAKSGFDENFILGPEFSEVMRLGGNTSAEKIRLFRVAYPKMGWDIDLLVLNAQIRNSGIISSEITEYFATAIDMIMKHLTEFLELAKRYKYIKFPLRYAGGCSCPVSTANIDNYILALADAAPSKEPVFSAHKGRLIPHSKVANLSFQYGFICSGIYLVHRCLQSWDLEANLLTSYNKLSPLVLEFCRKKC